MLAKTNAVLDGVTTFLKYGTLDSSNSDVRLGELDHPSSVWVTSVGWLPKRIQRTVAGLSRDSNVYMYSCTQNGWSIFICREVGGKDRSPWIVQLVPKTTFGLLPLHFPTWIIFCSGERAAQAECSVRQHECDQPGKRMRLHSKLCQQITHSQTK